MAGMHFLNAIWIVIINQSCNLASNALEFCFIYEFQKKVPENSYAL